MRETTPEQRAREFRDTRKTLHLATSDSDGLPEASYAPYVRLGADFYIYISEISQHTKNLLSRRAASVMFIEDEAISKNMFARIRLTMDAYVHIIARKSELWHLVMDAFKEKFGDFFDQVRPLEDFILFRLTPFNARYVEDIAKAYRLDANLTTAEHIRDGGHRPEKS